MTRLLLWTFERPVLTGVLLLAVTLGLGSRLPYLQVDASAKGLTMQHDPGRQFYEQARERFGSDDLTVVVVKAADVFAPDVLARVQRLSRALEGLEGVTRVDSLTTVRNIKGEGDQLDTEPLIGARVPDDPAALARIRRDALDNRVFVGGIVAADGRATAITVYTDPPPGDGLFDARFTAEVEALIQEARAPGVEIYQVGSILTRVATADYLARDQVRVVPIGIAVMLLVLFLMFRTLQGMVIPVVTAVLSIVWGVGLMAVAGIPMNLLTSIVPSLLLAVGFAEDVHMLAGYHERLGQGLPRLAAIGGMLQELALPLAITTGTTMVGFGSLILTDVIMLEQFGLASVLALGANFVVTLLLLPLMLRLWPVPRRLARPAARHGLVDRLMEGLVAVVTWIALRHRWTVLAVAGIVMVLSLTGWWHLRVDTDFVSLLPRDSYVRHRLADLHQALGGGLSFYVVVDTGREGGVKDPEVLRRIGALQDHLAATGRADKTVSVADYLRRLHREMNGGDPAMEVIPDSEELIAQYLLLLEGRELAKFLSFDASAANILVRHNLTGSWAVSALRREVEDYIAREFPPTLVARPTGEAILTNNAVDFLAVNELTSLATTFVVIGLIHAGLFMSLAAGFLSMIPNVVPVLANYGLMGLIGVPLDISTALIATIAIGIAVDDTVHHMVTYSRQLREHHDRQLAMVATLRSQARPIVYVSLALAAGLLVLVFAELRSTVQFGLLAAFVMLAAMVGELTLTPVLMYMARLVTVWDLLLLRMDPAAVARSPLFRDLSRWEVRKVVLLGRLQQVPAGQLVVDKGQVDDGLYLVVSGRLRAFDRGRDGVEKVLDTLEPGAIFGEVALVTREPRSASVVAEVDAEVLRLDFAAFERIRRRFPYTGARLFRNLARVLGDRLRRATEALVDGGATPPARPATDP